MIKPRSTMLFALFLVLAVVTMSFGEEEGKTEDQSYKDTPYFSGMPNYSIVDQQDKEFDAYQFSDGKKIITVEGRLWRKQYQLKENAQQASDLQIDRNYSNAVKGMGGEVLFEGACGVDGWGDKPCCQRAMTGIALRGNKELWVEVAPCNDGLDYWITVLEKEAMRQDVAYSGILNALNTEGHIALYINFDTGKSAIKPESDDVIRRIASMMKDNPNLRISVEGHTDNVGDPGKNRILSEERAKAVVAAVVKLGVDTTSLNAAGFGQDKPIADNKTEEGRAKNRRVELVKK